MHRPGPTLIESLWRYRLIVLAAALMAGTLGYFLASQQTPSYDAGARLFLADPGRTPGLEDGFSNQVDVDEFVPQQAARASSRAVFIGAADMLSPPIPLQEFIESVNLQQSPADLSLTIVASSPDPERAAAMANALATSYMQFNLESEREAAARAALQLELQSEDLEARLSELELQLDDEGQNLAIQSQIQNLSLRLIDIDRLVNTLRSDAELRGDGVDVFEPAEVPEGPSRPQIRLQAAAFAFMGLVSSSVWAYWYAGHSQRALNRRDPEAILGVPLLGEIPLYRTSGDNELSSLLRVDPAAAEAYEFVLSSIEFALGDDGGRSLLITSTLPGDGKTTTALQLAIAASRDRRRVVLVDADIRARGLTAVLGAQDRIGLSDLAALDLKPSDVMQRYRFSEQSQIPVVTAGQRRGDPAALLRTHSFRRAMTGISEAAELVIVDTSPLLAVADATIVAAAADGMVIVVSHGTLMSELQKVRERLKFVSTPLLGYVFNRSDATTAAAYGYGYGLTEDDDGQRRLLPRRSRRGGTPQPRGERRRLPATGGDATDDARTTGEGAPDPRIPASSDAD
jgi:capsular exopolysaccharide synthesis family protein